MWIVKLEANSNGSHNDHNAEHITKIPEGWAMIPDDFIVPKSFPFVDVEAEEITYYRDIKNKEGKIEKFPHKVMTVISMSEKEIPEVEQKEAATQLDRVEAQATYTAMITDTLLPYEE